MDQYLSLALTWAKSNPWTTFAVLYLLVNLSKRIPAPANPYLYVLWHAWESLMLLAGDSWGIKPQALPLPAKPDDRYGSW